MDLGSQFRENATNYKNKRDNKLFLAIIKQCDNASNKGSNKLMFIGSISKIVKKKLETEGLKVEIYKNQNLVQVSW